MKNVLLILSILLATAISIGIGFYNYNRLFPVETPITTIQSPVQPEFESFILDDASLDSVTKSPKINRQPSSLPDGTVSTPTEFEPSMNEMRVKFWVDLFVYLLEAISPLLVPIIVWKYKTKK